MLNRKFKLLLIPCYALFCLTAQTLLAAELSANPLPSEFVAHYESSKGLVSGKTTVSLKALDNKQFHYQSTTSVSGIMSLFSGSKIQEESYWEYINGNIRPTKYLYKRTGSKKRDAELSFDWQKKIVTNLINAKPWRMAINDNTLDKLVYQLVMMQDLRSGIYPGKKDLEYSIADGGTLKQYTISILGEEQLSTRLGTLHTIKVQRINGKRTTTMWCASKLGYLPVLIQQKKKGGSEYSAKIYKLEGFDEFKPE